MAISLRKGVALAWTFILRLPRATADHNCAACEEDGHLMGPTIDFPANDLLQTTVKDSAECCQSCLISNACKMWVVSYPDERTCWLKNGIHKSTRVEAQDRASGLTCGCDSTCPGALDLTTSMHTRTENSYAALFPRAPPPRGRDHGGG